MSFRSFDEKIPKVGSFRVLLAAARLAVLPDDDDDDDDDHHHHHHHYHHPHHHHHDDPYHDGGGSEDQSRGGAGGERVEDGVRRKILGLSTVAGALRAALSEEESRAKRQEPSSVEDVGGGVGETKAVVGSGGASALHQSGPSWDGEARKWTEQEDRSLSEVLEARSRPVQEEREAIEKLLAALQVARSRSGRPCRGDGRDPAEAPLQGRQLSLSRFIPCRRYRDLLSAAWDAVFVAAMRIHRKLLSLLKKVKSDVDKVGHADDGVDVLDEKSPLLGENYDLTEEPEEEKVERVAELLRFPFSSSCESSASRRSTSKVWAPLAALLVRDWVRRTTASSGRGKLLLKAKTLMGGQRAVQRSPATDTI